MRSSRTRVAFSLYARDLLRRRIVLLLMLLVPAVFYSIMFVIATTKPITFQLAAIEEEDYLQVPQRHEALVFIGLAAIGVLTSFLGMNLSQRDVEVHRRLVVCGYRPAEIAAARLGVLACVVALMSAFVASFLGAFFSPQNPWLVYAGFALCGWVYGSYGLLVGALFRQELEGILFVVLLANIDIGWLQNPIYYLHAQHQLVIRSLPGFWPSQVAMAAAFSEHTALEVLPTALKSAAYGAALIALAIAVYARRARRA
jgi:ABC-2 type transport system permease protein